MSQPKISVIVPAYNAAVFISDAIESLLIQTSPNWELVIVDDGSTDNTLDILKKYATLDNRIKVFTQENSGPSAARKYGVEHSTGQWITFLDADDCLISDAIDIFTKKTKEKSSNIYIFSHQEGEWEFDWQYKSLTINYDKYRTAAIRQLFCKGPVCKLFNKAVMCGGQVLEQPAKMNYGEDWVMNIRIAFQLNSTATFCEEIVYKYRIDTNPQSLTKTHKPAWDYDNILYREIVKSVPKEYEEQYAGELVEILSKVYHTYWRKIWNLPDEAHSSYIYNHICFLCKKYDLTPQFYESLDMKVTNPIIRFIFDMIERCYGLIKRYIFRYKPSNPYVK